MTDDSWRKTAQNLVRAVSTPTDQLAAKMGEDNLLVRVKRNSDRLAACDRHEFEPQPDWRSQPLYPRPKVRCRQCGGEMEHRDAMLYLRGFAHGSGQDHDALCNAVWPS